MMDLKGNEAYEVFIVGRYFCDLVFTGLQELPRLGHEIFSKEFNLVPGGVYNAASALHRLGVKTVWPCAFGSDPFSQYVKIAAIKEGMDTSFFDDLQQPFLHLTVAFSHEKERGFLSYSDPLPKYAYSNLIKETRPKWVYITHLVIGDELQDMVDAARAVGAQVFMDCQAHQFSLADKRIQRAIRMIDIFSPNKTEAAGLTGKRDIDDMVSALSQYAPTVIIKDGENGSYYRKNDHWLHVPSIAIDVVDTTGAGDNFDSGFLYGMVKGYSIEDCLKIGNYCAAISATGYGGSSRSPREKELLAYLNS